MKDNLETIKGYIEEEQSKINRSKNVFKKYVEKFDLTKFLKLLETKSDKDVFSLIIEASNKKVLKDIGSIKYNDLSPVIELGNILPLVSNNFIVKNVYEDIEETNSTFTIDHTFLIIYSKINKYFYVMNSRKIIDIESINLKYLKKCLDKKKAIIFIKKQIQDIKKDNSKLKK